MLDTGMESLSWIHGGLNTPCILILSWILLACCGGNFEKMNSSVVEDENLWYFSLRINLSF